MSFCIFASSVGIQSLVYLCCVEYLPSKVCAKILKKKKIDLTQFLFNFPDSNFWFGDHLRFKSFHYICLPQFIPNFVGNYWSLWMYDDICDFERFRRNFRGIFERNQWKLTWCRQLNGNVFLLLLFAFACNIVASRML